MTGLVVVGDTLWDREVDGSVTRTCPDAPVPVLSEESTSDRPGGAGLAALLAARDGLDVTLVTALADDLGGATLGKLLAAAGVVVHPLRRDGATPEKVRLRAGGQVLLRLDRGDRGGACGEPPGPALAALADADGILVSDYGYGVAGQHTLRGAVAEASAPVVWDPHPHGPAPVPGVRLATPNEAEVHQLVGGGPRGHRLTEATRGGYELRRRWRAGAVAVTMGADGALLCHARPTPHLVPVPASVDGDTCGAGDRFAVSAAAALARGAWDADAVRAAVTGATDFLVGGGVRAHPPAPPSPAEGSETGRRAAADLVVRVRQRGGRVVATGGCFDLLHAGHVATLETARRLGDCLVVCLNSDASVTRLKGPGRPVASQADRARLLAALSCVDAVVVFDEPDPRAVLSWLRPDVWVKGGDYQDEHSELPEEDLLRRWGGQTVLAPHLEGRSTTALLATTRAQVRPDHRAEGAIR